MIVWLDEGESLAACPPETYDGFGSEEREDVAEDLSREIEEVHSESRRRRAFLRAETVRPS